MNRKKTVPVSVIGVRGFPSDFPGTSGVEVYVEKVLKTTAAIDKNIQFTVYTKSNYRPPQFKHRGITVVRLPTLHTKVGESVMYALLASVRAAADDSLTVWYQGPGMAVFSFLPWLRGKKIIVTVHGFDWERQKWNRIEQWLFTMATQFVLALKPTLTAVSSRMQQRLQKNFNRESVLTVPGIEKIVVPNPKPFLKKYGLKRNGYILYVGRLVPEKRVEWLLDAYLKLAKKTNLKVVIIGQHGNVPDYEKNLRHTYTHPNIIWAGYVTNQEKYALLAQCAVYVLPSEVEGGNSLSFLEAISLKKVCLVPTESITPNFKIFPNVFYFPLKKRRKFVETLSKLVLMKKVQPKFTYKTAQLRELKKYSWLSTANLYLQLFR